MIPIRINELNDVVSNKYLSLNSCGINKISNIETGSLRPNGRHDYHIIYVLSGKCYVDVNGEYIAANSGDLVLYYPGEPQNYKYLREDETISCFLHFSGAGCDELLKEFGFSNSSRIFNLGIIPNVEKIIGRMRFECTQKKQFYEHRTSALLLELLSIFGRRLSEMAVFDDDNYISRIDNVCKLMLEDNDSWHNMEYYAERCYLSVSRFEHVFHEITGMSPNKYLMNLRINRAKEFLAETDLSVAGISNILGFSSMSYFIRIFKQYTGSTPVKFRNGFIKD